MKTIAYIYTILRSVADKSITPKQALDMIRLVISQ